MMPVSAPEVSVNRGESVSRVLLLTAILADAFVSQVRAAVIVREGGFGIGYDYGLDEV